jgi:hypothetical protein
VAVSEITGFSRDRHASLSLPPLYRVRDDGQAQGNEKFQPAQPQGSRDGSGGRTGHFTDNVHYRIKKLRFS